MKDLKSDNRPLSYEEAKDLASHKDVEVRRQLASREDIRPEILFYLAGDPSPEVRRVIMRNANTPSQAFTKLAEDKDEDVRSGLAERIAKLAPTLTDYERDRVQGFTYQALEILTRDQVGRVRTALAQTLKDLTGAPEDLILKLARDTQLEVCVPVLESSPVISDDNLVEIIQSGLQSGALGAISRRSHVSASVADAIVQTDDADAITQLLCNDNAQIREETLDNLVDRSRKVERWQGPLIHRPVLSDQAVLQMASFVADNLLEQLRQRSDLKPELLDKVKDELQNRLKTGKSITSKATRNDSIDTLKREFIWLFQQPPHVVAKQLKKMARLDERVIRTALQEGDREFAVAAISELAGIQLSLVLQVLSMRTPRGVTALCWKAGLSMDMAEYIQGRLGRVPPTDVIIARHDGSYPMTDKELEWQVNFIMNMGG